MLKGLAVAVLLTGVVVAGVSQQFWSGKKRAMIGGMTERRLSQFEALSATHAAVVLSVIALPREGFGQSGFPEWM